ncbi:MAG: hypothetical protein JXB30_00340 [Anaerolineae bacterium]|nr:hypothetical protein [Anaerolineae bacterium]
MLPASSVSGCYFAHPQATYFGIRRIGKDQAADYARRKGMDLPETEKWLAPNLEQDCLPSWRFQGLTIPHPLGGRNIALISRIFYL